MPNGTTLIAGLIFGSIGMGYFIYGKKKASTVFRYTGIALMVYPYFIENALAIFIVGAGLMILPRFVEL